MQLRVVAIATGLILLCVGLMANRHAAEVAHVREQSGRIVHAQQASEHHEASTSAHLHGIDGHTHAGDCELLALAHERITIAKAPVIVAPVATTFTFVTAAVHDIVVTRAAYRIAPKTSPPLAA
jgi:hypothetical protein